MLEDSEELDVCFKDIMRLRNEAKQRDCEIASVKKQRDDAIKRNMELSRRLADEMPAMVEDVSNA